MWEMKKCCKLLLQLPFGHSADTWEVASDDAGVQTVPDETSTDDASSAIDPWWASQTSSVSSSRQVEQLPAAVIVIRPLQIRDILLISEEHTAGFVAMDVSRGVNS